MEQNNISIPEKIKQFVDQQETIPIPQEYADYPYSEFWYKAVAGILLSGRVKAKNDGYPNMTDVNRVCKQANFNQYYFEGAAKFLIKTKIISQEDGFRNKNYCKGENFDTFWGQGLAKMQTITKDSLLDFVQENTGYGVWRPTFANHSSLIEFLEVFFKSFEGLALPEKKIGNIFLEFCKLSIDDITPLLKISGTEKESYHFGQWKDWLDKKGQEALLSALYSVRWVYVMDQDNKKWVYFNQIGRMMLGFESPPSPPEQNKEFKVLPNLNIKAGVDIPIENLATLFRYCKITKIAPVCEFQLDKKTMKEVPTKTSAVEELQETLLDLDPLPPEVNAFFETQQQHPVGGVLRMRYCSAIVRPDNPELIPVIRSHPKLKWYIEPNSPKGYLLIKSESNPYNFIQRCKEFGFEVKSL